MSSRPEIDLPCPIFASGKFFRAQTVTGSRRIQIRGISYGPFRPGLDGQPFPEETRLTADLEQIQAMGFDTLRIYHPPSESLLNQALRLGLRLLVGIAWTDHVDFLRCRKRRQEALQTVQETCARLRGHPSVVGFFVGNEIEKTLVRWMGPRRVRSFLERLIAEGRRAAPDKLFSYATYPSTEYLIPRNVDFLAVNVYLERREDFAAYLQRLQHLAGNKPLVISEFGLDTLNHGAEKQSEVFEWFEAECRRAAVAGTLWFSYTDEWFRGGREVTEWRFGLVDAQRRPRFAMSGSSRLEPEAAAGLISVIVCTYNGSATLSECLASLQKLNHPDYEVLVVDDGSTEDIRRLVAAFPEVRYVRQEHAGLSAARNRGMKEARGSILAYTDDDCLADEDWLLHLTRGFDAPEWVACGGPNIPPGPRNAAEAIVAAAPGAPAHVMLNDLEAEHLPGCNLAIRKTALEAIGGFREHYQTAGDDVDVCWRLRDAGGKLRFQPGAMVWHHRRRCFSAYLKQQRGYGHAEALLMKDHPHHFGLIGGARWRGAIYGDASATADLGRGCIFHGPQGSGLFQGIYHSSQTCRLEWFSGVLWPLMLAITAFLGWWWVAAGIVMTSLAAALYRWRSLPCPPHPLSASHQAGLLILCWLQPPLREGARLAGMLDLGAWPAWNPFQPEVLQAPPQRQHLVKTGEWAFWSDQGIGREMFLAELQKDMQERLGSGSVLRDDGWRNYDLAFGHLGVSQSAYLTVTEHHGPGLCLTRVRHLHRHWPILILVCALLGSALFADAADKLGQKAVFYLTLFVLYLAILRWREGRYLRSIAARCGLKPLTHEP